MHNPKPNIPKPPPPPPPRVYRDGVRVRPKIENHTYDDKIEMYTMVITSCGISFLIGLMVGIFTGLI